MLKKRRKGHGPTLSETTIPSMHAQDAYSLTDVSTHFASMDFVPLQRRILRVFLPHLREDLEVLPLFVDDLVN